MSAQLRQKILAPDLASMLIDECVDAQHIKPLRENLSSRETDRFANTVRRYQLAGLLMTLGAASHEIRTFDCVRELVEALEFHGRIASEVSQLRGDMAVTIESLRALVLPQGKSAQFTWARTWYQDIGVNEANPAVLGHLAIQWLDFYALVQRTLQQFEPQVEAERSAVATSAPGSDAHNILEPDDREIACMALVSVMRVETARRRLEEHAARSTHSLYWIILHPIAYLRHCREIRGDKRSLDACITAQHELRPVAPKKKRLDALWDSCGLSGVATVRDDDAVALIQRWIGILYGDDVARRVDLVTRLHQIADEQSAEEEAAAQVGDSWDFAPPIESLLYQLSNELPEYRKSV